MSGGARRNAARRIHEEILRLEAEQRVIREAGSDEDLTARQRRSLSEVADLFGAKARGLFQAQLWLESSS